MFSSVSGRGVSDRFIAIYIASAVDANLIEAHSGKIKAIIGIMLLQAVLVFFIAHRIGNTLGPTAHLLIGTGLALIPLLFAWGFLEEQGVGLHLLHSAVHSAIAKANR